jgi:molybdenum cofactor cytidylyltransferase
LKDRVVAGVLLAAGESTRMGTTKALLPWMGTTLIDYQIRTMLQASISTIVIVLGHDAERVGAAIAPLQEGLHTIVNPGYREGRAGSIRTGVQILPPAVTDILIHSVDQPRSARTLISLVQSHLGGRHLITVPAYGGCRGHPPVISTVLLPDLLTLTEKGEGLRGFMRRHAAIIAQADLREPEILINLNTPSQYRQALRAFESAR